MSLKINHDHVVTIHYTLTNSQGEVLDSSEGGGPLTYLHGAGNIIPGLEEALSGKISGDSFKASIQPEQGYGPHYPQLVQILPRSAFGDTQSLEVGMEFTAQGADGELRRVGISAINGDQITIDGNHPLAGEVLHFNVTVENVRAATTEEKDHGHVHGPGGHHH